jgi:hypothetical protein
MATRYGFQGSIGRFFIAGFIAIAVTPAFAGYHTADSDQSHTISLSELLRLIQFFNADGIHCDSGTEDGYAPLTLPLPPICPPHDSDYAPTDWHISLNELLRLIQFFNSGGYHQQCDTEDDHAPGLGADSPCPGQEGEGEGEGWWEGEGYDWWEGEGESLDSGSYTGGSGIESDPFLISTPADLIELADYTHRVDWDKHFLLTQDINMTEVAGFVPIGSDRERDRQERFQGYEFNGIFDGGGHRILGLVIDAPDDTFVGLFGRLGINAIVRNLGLEAGRVRGLSHVGGLAGWNAGGMISGCYAEMNVGGYSYIGGLAGRNEGIIVSCYAAGTVEGEFAIAGLSPRNEGRIVACYASNTFLGTLWPIGLTNGPFTATSEISYWDAETSCTLLGNAGLGLTRAQMTSVAFFQHAAWRDYGWVMEEGSYPRLAWENSGAPPIPPPAAAPFEGTGTETDPYQIRSREDFRQLSWRTDLYARVFRLDSDLDLADDAILAIGSSRPFAGVFDGNGHRIANVNITGTTTAVALFGELGTAGILRNLHLDNASNTNMEASAALVFTNKGTIEDCSVNANIYREFSAPLAFSNDGHILRCHALGRSGGTFSAGLVHSNQGTIEECYSTVEIDGSSHSGGLVGNNTGMIQRCYATGNISGFRFFGGLAGYNRGTIIACYATGDTSGREVLSGGLVGQNAGIVLACYATGVAPNGLATQAQNAPAGVFISSFWDVDTSGTSVSVDGRGLPSATMTSSALYQDAGWGAYGWAMTEGQYPRLVWEQTGAPAIAPPDAVPFAGNGSESDPYLVGTAEELVLLSGHAGVTHAHIRITQDIDCMGKELWPIGEMGEFNGYFDGNGHTIRNVRIVQPERQFIGFFRKLGPDAIVRDLTLVDVTLVGDAYLGGLAVVNAGMVTNCRVAATLTGSSHIGGLVAMNEGEIRECGSSVQITGDHYIGGLVASNENLITKCYANVNITGTSILGGLASLNGSIIEDSFALGILTHSELAGGLIARAAGDFYIHRPSVVRRCFAAVMLSHSTDAGLIGSGDYLSVHDSFWDIDVSRCDKSYKGIGLTTGQMMNHGFFIGWDFETIWGIDEGMSYPYLKWAGDSGKGRDTIP